jgi:SAM-dependent methyltransferase
MDVIQFLNEERRWYSSAKVYAELAPKISAYNITADRLIQLSRIKNGEAIIDLGCGSSGLLINKILSKEPEVTVIYGVDISKEMLNVLNENIVSNSRIKLLHCAAERIQLFLEHKVDRILINSAIWLFSLPDVFVSARNVLNDDGLLVFNIAEWDFILDKSEGRARRGMIDEVLYSHNFTPKRSCGPRTKMTVDELCGILSTTMFDIIQLNYFTTPM